MKVVRVSLDMKLASSNEEDTEDMRLLKVISEGFGKVLA